MGLGPPPSPIPSWGGGRDPHKSSRSSSHLCDTTSLSPAPSSSAGTKLPTTRAAVGAGSAVRGHPFSAHRGPRREGGREVGRGKPDAAGSPWSLALLGSAQNKVLERASPDVSGGAPRCGNQAHSSPPKVACLEWGDTMDCLQDRQGTRQGRTICSGHGPPRGLWALLRLSRPYDRRGNSPASAAPALGCWGSPEETAPPRLRGRYF